MERFAGRFIAVLILSGLFLAAGGCSVKKMATNAMANSVAGNSDVYSSDEDIELVGQAIPFGLKTMESLLAEVPEHKGLLLAAARGFTQYAYVYIEQPANELEDSNVSQAYAQRERARRMYLRARDYGLRGLAVGHAEVMKNIYMDPDKAVAKMKRKDVPLLYWTAAAWASAISLSKDDPALIADLPIIQALIYRAYDLDEAFDDGAIHSFLISYEMSKPGTSKETIARARKHFERAVELSEGALASPYISLAEAVSIYEQNRREYRSLLKKALAVDVDRKPEQRLANLVMQRRAQWLLDHTDNFFLE